MGNIVEVINVSKNYGDIKAVENISFNVKEGEFYSLLGPSGCGKTTILRILGGFIEQDSGKVIIDGKDMKGISPNRRNTSMVFQDLALFPHMNVRENIIYGLRKRKTRPAAIDKKFKRIVDTLGLSGFGKRPVSALSGGQRQRVALARSLIIEPEILLLDEPLASLDKKLRIAMQDELKKIQRKIGTTFLYVTHDQGEALTMSDTIAVMNEGKIIQTGSPDYIYDYPDNIFTADFIGAGNFIPLSSVNNNGQFLSIRAEKGGEFRSASRIPHSKSLSVPVFFIRPEKIKIGSNNPENSNIFTGTVIASVFEGPDIRFEVDSLELGILRIEIKNDGTPPGINKSGKITFYWSYKDGMVLFR
ncbi:MAG: ABC transporter ATP-binding protein [Actinobacteria bacterium]|nr:ABC transporter ATP-binding protein [Actinomycetota bacterium]